MGRWDAVLWCESDGNQATCISREGALLGSWDDPLDALQYLARFDLRDNPHESARWVGYLGYDLGRLFEHLPPRVRDDVGLPLFAFVLCGSTGDSRHVAAPWHRRPDSRFMVSSFTREAYVRAVERAIEYVRAGDVFQVNLSQRLTVTTNLPAHVIDLRLRERGGARYGAYLHLGTFAVLSASPELFLRVDTGGRVTTRPIKGTRPAIPGMDGLLRASSKDEAELNMIVDLERNDLGRVCQTGTVRVTQPRAIEKHPTVYHGVATVEGVLRPDVTFVDLLRATFPGGSVTGAPKIRAMQIIDELEPVRRGPYCGAIGYVAADGTMEFNVAIRTMTVLPDGVVHVPVGGGIVADSDPAAEYEETLVKARAMVEALGVEG